MGLDLALCGIFRAYNGTPVLRDCSLIVAPGRTAVLMGPNGSGKSTLLRIAALLERPDQGEVKFRREGRLLPQDLELRRRITLVLPRIGVFNSSVFHNVAYGLKIRGWKRTEIKARVAEILGVVGLAAKKNDNALNLSSGETKRLGLARALVLQPEALILDEPTASIDQENTEIIEELVLQLKAAGKTTILLTTHDPAQARRLADALFVMEQGRLVSAA